MISAGHTGGGFNSCERDTVAGFDSRQPSGHGVSGDMRFSRTPATSRMPSAPADLPAADGMAWRDVLCECHGCGKQKPTEDFPVEPSIPGLCAVCDLTQRPPDEPMEACHIRASQNATLSGNGKQEGKQ